MHARPDPIYWNEIEIRRALTLDEKSQLAMLRAAGAMDGRMMQVFGPQGRNGLVT